MAICYSIQTTELFFLFLMVWKLSEKPLVISGVTLHLEMEKYRCPDVPWSEFVLLMYLSEAGVGGVSISLLVE